MIRYEYDTSNVEKYIEISNHWLFSVFSPGY